MVVNYGSNVVENGLTIFRCKKVKFQLGNIKSGMNDVFFHDTLNRPGIVIILD